MQCESVEFFVEKGRGFYFELKNLLRLYVEGFQLEEIPEMNKKWIGSPSDWSISKGGKKFQVECKTFNESLGHPIIQKAAIDSCKLISNHEKYKKMFPDHEEVRTLITIDKKLKNNYPLILCLEFYELPLEESLGGLMSSLKSYEKDNVEVRFYERNANDWKKDMISGTDQFSDSLIV